MTDRPTATPESRRGFLGKIVLTAAAGLGLAAVGGGSAAAAPRADAPAGDSRTGGGVAPQACGIYCSVYRCNECAPGRHLFVCRDQLGCGNPPSYRCYTRACSGFCLVQGAC